MHKKTSMTTLLVLSILLSGCWSKKNKTEKASNETAESMEKKTDENPMKMASLDLNNGDKNGGKNSSPDKADFAGSSESSDDGKKEEKKESKKKNKTETMGDEDIKPEKLESEDIKMDQLNDEEKKTESMDN